MNQDKKGKVFVSFGACFAGVGNGLTFKLSDIKLKGGRSTADNIQLLGAAKANVVATYCYLSEEEAIALGCEASDAGWYDGATGEIPMNDAEFPIGTAFLANFQTKGVTICSAGQVTGDGVALDCTGKSFVMFANIAPRMAKLGEFALVGTRSNVDNIQVLRAEDASVSATYAYFSAEEAAALKVDVSEVGWYDGATGEVSMDDVDVPAGSAFLGSFGSPNASIVFPKAVK